MFLSGLLLGLLVMYFVMRNKIKAVGDGAGQQADTGPVYHEVSPTSVKTEKFVMGENMAYGPTIANRNYV